MSRLLWISAWIGVAFWSLFAFATYGLLDLLGGVAIRNADMVSSDPETVEWLFNVLSWVKGFSVSAVLVVWGIVSIAILAVPWLFDRFVGTAVREVGPRRRPDGVIDLEPADYRVRDPQPPAAGPVPRLGPRP